MSSSPPLIHCPNPSCSAPQNALGTKDCENCQTPLVYRYLWATNSQVTKIPLGQIISDRYYPIAPQIWLDLQPAQLPEIPEPLPERILPYLRLYPQRLHVPEVYGFCQFSSGEIVSETVLLENAPINSRGSILPGIRDAWATATAVRQLYWLWQMLELWQPLMEQKAAGSLLVAENIRVEGWRVRLQELYVDGEKYPEMPGMKPRLSQLGVCWATWFAEVSEAIAPRLSQVFQQMQSGEGIAAIASTLNQLLLEQASQQYLRLRVAGGTDTGPQHSQNEDSCYPTAADIPLGMTQSNDPLLSYLSIVCDGIGGHEGGEVASQLAVQSLKLQIQALLQEIAQQETIMPPELVMEQLSALIRVANNLIAARNDEQGRESRQRMATTLVMALQLPQQVKTETLGGNSHEIYLVNVGDSRAYWITPEYCQQLTVDDDVATREVRTGRSLYRQALQRPDAGALTQAMGTRQSDLLRPTVQRIILEEDGILLLCSDGLCDNGLVEKSWLEYAEPILQSRIPLDAAVQAWIELANQKNGRDNVSVVLTHCRVSAEYPVLVNLGTIIDGDRPATEPVLSEMAESSKALLRSQAESTPEKSRRPLRRGLIVGLQVLGILVGSAGLGLLGLWLINPQGLQQLGDRWLRNTPLEPLLQPVKLPKK